MLNSNSGAQRLDQVQIAALVIAGIGLVLSILGGATADLNRFFQVYLVVFMFFLELALGCLGLLLASQLLKAGWSVAIQRFLAAGARTLPLLAVLFIPILANLGNLYPWVNNAAEQTAYLNTAFFVVRAVIYFAVWIGLAYLISGWSYQRDKQDDAALNGRIQLLSVVGIIVLFITASLAAVDWLMSLTPGWLSTVYGWLTMSRMGLAAMSFALLMVALLSGRQPLANFLRERIRVDLGALLLVTLMLWAYLAWMQYFIIYSADLAAKSVWYVARITGAWSTYITAFAVVHVGILVVLLLPGLKRLSWATGVVGALLLVLRLFELAWEVLPAFGQTFAFNLADVALVFAFAGVWVALLYWSLNSAPLLPSADLPAVSKETELKVAPQS
jgi:hypothetical protein